MLLKVEFSDVREGDAHACRWDEQAETSAAAAAAAWRRQRRLSDWSGRVGLQ